MKTFLGHYNYWIVIALMMIGLYAAVASGNFVKKIIGLNIFQTAAFLLFISMGKVANMGKMVILGLTNSTV